MDGRSHSRFTLLRAKRAAISGAVVLLLSSGAFPQPVAKVTAVVRIVQHLPVRSKKWLRTKVGTKLYTGWKVRTRKRSKCEIRFTDGSLVRLGPMARLTIRGVGRRGREMKLTVGRLFARIVKGSRYVIRGPTAVAAVRGTEFELIVDPWGREILRVFSGIVEWSTPVGTVTVGAGQESRVEPGKAPESPRPTAPKEFAGGEERPFWQDISPGTSLNVTAGTSVQEEHKEETETIRYSSEEVNEPEAESLGEEVAKEEGEAVVHIRQGFVETEGFSFTQRGKSLIGMRLRTRGVVGKAYFELAVMPYNFTDVGTRTVLSEGYVTLRRMGWGDLRIGRQRFLFSPVNNTVFGTLLKTEIADAVTLSTAPGSPVSAQLSYLYDADPFYGGREEGIHFRLSVPAFGGYFAVNMMRVKGLGSGGTMEFSLPVVRDKVEAYAELGADYLDYPVRTVGLYFPDLYQRYGLDLFVEVSGRGPLSDILSIRAYKEVGRNYTLLLALDKEEDGGWSAGAGLVARTGWPLWGVER